jgi:hypothetical protein
MTLWNESAAVQHMQRRGERELSDERREAILARLGPELDRLGKPKRIWLAYAVTGLAGVAAAALVLRTGHRDTDLPSPTLAPPAVVAQSAPATLTEKQPAATSESARRLAVDLRRVTLGAGASIRTLGNTVELLFERDAQDSAQRPPRRAVPAPVQPVPATPVETAESIYQLAEAGMRRRDWDASEKHLQRLLTRFADSDLAGLARYDLARIAVRLGQTDAANRHLDALLASSPSPELVEPARWLQCKVVAHRDGCLRDFAQDFPGSPHLPVAKPERAP